MAKPLGVNDIPRFGKYATKKIEEIIVDDPHYIAWCLDTIENFELDEEALQLLETSMRSIR